MFESNSQFPRFFVYMMSALVLFCFIGMFFGVKFVGAVYIIAIVMCALLLLLDRKYATLLTNYKLAYLMFDLINLIAIISAIYYEYNNYSDVLNLFLILLTVLEFVLIVIDIFVIKNKNFTRNGNLVIDFIKLCSMISLMTYFFNVSKLYFAIFSFLFEAVNLSAKFLLNFGNRFIKHEPEKQEKREEEIIESIIHSTDSEEGDAE